MNLILEKTDQVPFFTDMRLVLNALDISAPDYDWYVSDLECFAPDVSNEDRWLSGDELDNLLQRQEIQFIWAVFSAVPKGVRCDVPCPPHGPYADGNGSFWDGTAITPQLDGALFEIVCWDSSATLLIGISPEAAESFKNTYPDARPL